MRKVQLIVAVFLAIALGGAAHSAFFEWSKTAANNATADPTINWSEGQSPSSVNDSARAMMARLAEYRDDIAGVVTTGGTSSAYTVATNQGFTSLALLDGKAVAFTVHASNGSPATLNVDGLGAKPLRSSPNTEIPAGTLVLGSPYIALYNNSNNEFYLRGFYAAPTTIPLGGLIPYLGATAPNSNFVIPFGQCISRTTYATLFALVSTTFGTCDGTTTFGVIDLRGRLPAQLDTISGSAANRLTSSSTGCGTAFTSLGATCANGAESQTLTAAQIPAHTHTITDPGHVHSGAILFTGGVTSFVPGGAQGLSTQNTGSATTGITATNANTGGGGAHPNVMPVIGLYYLLRVL